MKPITTKIVDTPEGPAVLLPEGCRFPDATVMIRRAGELVVVAPIKPAKWPEGFFDMIHIDDPAFVRPDQGEMPPAPVFD